MIDEVVLVWALIDSRIAGAGLDVTANDPLPADDPLHTAPHSILFGHGAWFSMSADSAAEFWRKVMAQVALALKGR